MKAVVHYSYVGAIKQTIITLDLPIWSTYREVTYFENNKDAHSDIIIIQMLPGKQNSKHILCTGYLHTNSSISFRDFEKMF
jgi:hypothetical protein